MTQCVPSKVTLQDVAERAGVHRSTVALALRDHPRIPAETRQRIKDLALKLHYRINPLVSALMQSRRSNRTVKNVSIAYVTNYPTRYGWRPQHHDRPDFFPGAVERARDFGYKLEHFWLGEPNMTPERFCDILTVRGINGLIIGRLPPGQHSLDLAWERFSCVTLGMTLRSPVLHHVAENHFETVWQSMQQCLELGYRRIGFVFSEANDSPRVGDRWLSAFVGQQLKLSLRNRIPHCPMIPADEAAFADWFRKYQPDALLATHARPVLGWLRNMKVDVPRDVGLIDLEYHSDLGCAGVHYDPAKIGALAVEMLVGLLHRNETGIPVDPHEVLIKGQWREGSTLPRRKEQAASQSTMRALG